jgi:hypothetical protein
LISKWKNTEKFSNSIESKIMKWVLKITSLGRYCKNRLETAMGL